jgi:6-phosphogluconolactonase
MEACRLIICQDRGELAARAADLVIQCANDALERREQFTLVLSGGSTPQPAYALLARPDRAAAIGWSKTYILFGDERFVPPDDDRSNFAMAHGTLLSRLPIPPSHVFRVPAEAGSAAEAASMYASRLARSFSSGAGGAPPRFDLVLLGLGEDGHTASLFPGAETLREDGAWVAWSPPGALPPLVDRITLTYPVFNAARHVAFLVAGENKAAALREVLDGSADPERRPAAGIRPVDGTLTWLVDRSAAKLLEQESQT